MFDLHNKNLNDLYNNTKNDEDRYYENFDNYHNLFNAYFFTNLLASRQ